MPQNIAGLVIDLSVLIRSEAAIIKGIPSVSTYADFADHVLKRVENMVIFRLMFNVST